MDEFVVLVDEQDRQIGIAPKLAAHQGGLLHRAFSVFVFDSQGRVLLQQRAAGKYHSGGRWSNTCCGHPRPGESVVAAAERRLTEEMGVACPLTPARAFTYQAAVGSGLVEHEYDHVLVGRCEGEPQPAPAEVAGWRWATAGEIDRELAVQPDRFTAWFPEAWAAARTARLAGGRGEPRWGET